MSLGMETQQEMGTKQETGMATGMVSFASLALWVSLIA